MKMKHLTLTLLIFGFLLSSCTNMPVQKNKKGQVGATAGIVTGALIGQMIGHNTEATLIGTAVGGLLGYVIGNEMDKYDRQQLNYVYERGISGHTSTWVNPDNNNQYKVTPQPAYNPTSSQVCRQAEIEAMIDGRVEKTYTTACRDQYGRWHLQN